MGNLQSSDAFSPATSSLQHNSTHRTTVLSPLNTHHQTEQSTCHPNPLLSNSPATSPPSPTLPDTLLIEIASHLPANDLHNLLYTSRKLCTLDNNTYFQAKWLRNRYCTRLCLLHALVHFKSTPLFAWLLDDAIAQCKEGTATRQMLLGECTPGDPLQTQQEAAAAAGSLQQKQWLAECLTRPCNYTGPTFGEGFGYKDISVLHAAVHWCNDLDILRRLLSVPGIDTQMEAVARCCIFRPACPGYERHGWTPLHAACEAMRLDVVDLLLDCAHVDLAAKLLVVGESNVSPDQTPLHLACRKGHAGIVAAILHKAAVADNASGGGNGIGSSFTLLGSAGQGSRISAGATLRELIEARTCEGATALHLAAEHGHIKVVEVLLLGGADVNAVIHQVTNGDFLLNRHALRLQALHLAAGKGHARVCRVLLEHGANVNARDGNGESALHYAARKGDMKVAMVLVDAAGVDVDLRAYDGTTPVSMACDRWCFFVMWLLWSADARFNAPQLEIALTPVYMLVMLIAMLVVFAPVYLLVVLAAMLMVAIIKRIYNRKSLGRSP